MGSKHWLDARLLLLDSPDTGASADPFHDNVGAASSTSQLDLPESIGTSASQYVRNSQFDLHTSVRRPPGLPNIDPNQPTSSDISSSYQPSPPANLDVKERSGTRLEAQNAERFHCGMKPVQPQGSYHVDIDQQGSYHVDTDAFVNVLQDVLSRAHGTKKPPRNVELHTEFSMSNQVAILNIKVEAGVVRARTFNTLWHALSSCRLFEHTLRVLVVRVDGRPSDAQSPDLSEAETRREASITDFLVLIQAFSFPVIGMARGDVMGFGAAILSCCDVVLVHSCTRICFGQTVQDRQNAELAWALPLLLSERVGSRVANALLADEWPKPLSELMQLGFITDVAKTDAELDCMENMLVRQFSHCDIDGVHMLKSALRRRGDRSTESVAPRGSSMSQCSGSTTTSFSQASHSQSQISSDWSFSTASTWAGHTGVPGGESETTLMICNLPCSLTLDQLGEAIDKMGFKKKYDFLHLPCSDEKDDARRKSNIGYGFINLIGVNEANRFREAFEGYRFEGFFSEKSVAIRVADVQKTASKSFSKKKYSTRTKRPGKSLGPVSGA